MPTETIPTAATELVDETPKELQVIVQENSLQPATAQSLQSSFAPIFQKARSVIDQSRSIVVTDASQKLEMKMARACRLELKALRVSSDKTRKELKDESLRTGRAIDAFHNILLHLTETEEKRLQAQEDFVEQQETARKNALVLERSKILTGIQVDPTLYSLGEMQEETFQQLVEGTRLARAAEVERQRKVEAERIEQQQKEAAERERIRLENERLKQEAADKAAAEKAERARKHDLHCTRMAILGAEDLLSPSEVSEGAVHDTYAIHTEEEFVAILGRLRTRKVEHEQAIKAAAETHRKLRELEIEAAAQRDREAKERAELEAKVKRERELAAKKHAEESERAERMRLHEKAARERAEADLKAERDRLAKLNADEAEAARKLAAAPDKDRLLNYANAIRGLDIPELKSAPALATLIQQQRDKFVAWLETSVDKI